MPTHKGNVLTTGQLATSGTATSLVASNPARVMLIISNNNTSADFFVGNSASVNVTNGHLVLRNTTLYLDNYTGPIFTVSAATPTATYIEY
jgi:hypothetical protein